MARPWQLALTLAFAAVGCRAPLELPPLPPRALESAARDEPEIEARSGAGELPRMLLATQPATPSGLGPLAGESIEVDARVLGDEARVRVRQRVRNPYDRSIAVDYEFALPEHATVDRVRARVGERTIASEVRPRESTEGKPQTNLFRQTLSPVPPGGSVEVELEYLQALTRDDGEYELVFPLLPRQPERGALSLELEVVAGAPIDRWRSSSPRLEGAATATGFSARLDDFDERDLVLRWTPTPAKTQAILHRTPPGADGHGYFSLQVLGAEPTLLPPRELIFVIDSSPSMAGAPLHAAKWVIRYSLERLRPTDSFNILTFGGPFDSPFERPQPASKANLLAAERFLEQLETRRGSQTLPAIEAALRPAIGADERRFVVFLTDGAVARDSELVAAAGDLVTRAEAVGARAHVFAVSPSADRDDDLLRQLAEAGNTKTVIGGERPAVDALFRYVDPPALAELEIAWPGVVIDAIYPRELPDLAAGDELVLVGRHRGTASAEPVLRGRIPGEAEPVEIAVTTTPEADERLIETRWARARIDELFEQAGGNLDAIRSELTALGLAHQLVTPYTSVVAIGGDQPQVLLESPVNLETIVSLTSYPIEYTCRVGYRPIYIQYIQPSADDEAELLPLGHADWAPDSVLWITRLESSAGVDRRAIRRSLRERAAELEACHEIHRSKADKRRLRYRIHFDAEGEVLATELLEGSFGDAGERCLEAVFHRVAWQGLPRARAVVEVQLQLRLR